MAEILLPTHPHFIGKYQASEKVSCPTKVRELLGAVGETWTKFGAFETCAMLHTDFVYSFQTNCGIVFIYSQLRIEFL